MPAAKSMPATIKARAKRMRTIEIPLVRSRWTRRSYPHWRPMHRPGANQRRGATGIYVLTGIYGCGNVSPVSTLTFSVLAEPARRDILDLLRERERSVGDLVDALPLTQPGVSKHLRVLRE